MAFIFADSFDFYNTTSFISDGGTHWDTVAANIGPGTVSSRFSGTYAAFQNTSAPLQLGKTSATNDAGHHLVFAYRNNGGTTSGNGFTITFMDGTTAQCSVVFDPSGPILLKSGLGAGTTLATFTGAIPSTNIWYGIEIEVVINNTTGSFKVRLNGNTTDDFAATGLNTRGGTTNNYANKIQIGTTTTIASSPQFQMDDFLWFSTTGAAPNTWVGDVRAQQLMPLTDASAALSKSPSTSTFSSNQTTTQTGGPTANTIWWFSVQAPYNGAVTSLYGNFGNAVTGHVNMAIYDATGPLINGGFMGAYSGTAPGPGILLGVATPLTNPGIGVQTFTLVTPATVVKNQYLWLGMIADTSLAAAIYGTINCYSATLAYTYAGGAFPATATGVNVSTLHNAFSNL